MPRRGQLMPAELPTLIYDGECGLCMRSMELMRRWDREHRLRYVPFQDEAAVARFRVPLPALAAPMPLVFPDGRVCPGADAAPEVLRLLPRKRWLAVRFAGPDGM